MDEYTAEAFANRDDPVPLISVTHSDAEGSSSEVDKRGQRDRLKQSLSASKLRSKAQDLKEKHLEKVEDASDASLSLQDRLFAKLLQQMIPSEDVDNDDKTRGQAVFSICSTSSFQLTNNDQQLPQIQCQDWHCLCLSE